MPDQDALTQATVNLELALDRFFRCGGDYETAAEIADLIAQWWQDEIAAAEARS